MADRRRWLPRLRGRGDDDGRMRASIDQVPWWDVLGDPLLYPLFQQTIVGDKLQISRDFAGLVEGALKSNPIVFAVVANRIMLFREARFQWRQRRNGRPGDLFGTPDLAPLEQPWPGGTTGDLLAIAEGMNSCAGNFFAVRIGDRIKPLRPDFTTIALDIPEGGTPYDPDVEVLGYIYQPPGRSEPLIYTPEEVAHWKPIPDPEAPWRGMSWMTPAIQEILADRELTSHKRKFTQGGMTPNLAVKLNVETIEKFNEWVTKYREEREGNAGNPYRTLFLGAGADPVPIGTDLEKADFAKVMAGGEVRIAAAGMTHPAMVGLMEGLQGSTLNAGNQKEVRRQFANMLIRPLWGSFAGCISQIVPPPPDAELWYDDRDIPALAEDGKDAADILQVQASTIKSLIDAGYEPDSVVEAVNSNDLSMLVHTGMVSVQLLPPGTPHPSQPNGNGTNGHAALALPISKERT